MNSDKYLLAIIVPPPVSNYIDLYRKKYDEADASTISPHLTICPPFYLNITETELTQKLSQIFSSTTPFPLSLTSTDFFEGKNNVAFFKPDHFSSQNIRHLLVITQSNLTHDIVNVWPDYPTDPDKFVPHCTIVEHIDDDKFSQVKADLELLTVDQSFEVNSLFLIKKQSEQWLPITEISFQLPRKSQPL